MTPEIEKDNRPTGDPALASASGSEDYRPRTEMKCRVCGCFSSAQTCWHCATNPGITALLNELAELKTDKARLDWLEQGTSEIVKSANDFVDWKIGRITRAKIDAAMYPPND